MIWNREPVAVVNAVRLVILAGVSFGLDLEPGQIVAVMGALEAVLTLVARSAVVPNDTVDEHLDTAERLFRMGGKLPPADDIPAAGSPLPRPRRKAR